MAWAPDYITLQEFKDYKKINDDVDDVQLSIAIAAASRAVDDCCNRQFGQVAVAEERTYTAWYDYSRGKWIVDIDDLQTAVGLSVVVDGTTVTDYTLEPRNNVAKGLAWTRLVFGTNAEVFPSWEDDYIVTPTGAWGWAATPTAVKQATYIQADRFSTRRDSPYGIAGSPGEGSEMRLLSKVDPDVRVALRKYIRPRAIG